VVGDIHDDNTESLRGGEYIWKPQGEMRERVKEESAALRRVRDALRRQMPEEDEYGA